MNFINSRKNRRAITRGSFRPFMVKFHPLPPIITGSTSSNVVVLNDDLREGRPSTATIKEQTACADSSAVRLMIQTLTRELSTSRLG
ncbi:hypothetical protein EVAR_35628_1 [Eumeta japonica]|uniref:Uncharacterized protein n=1 Tax=Eumeta variegata TaxID=151549 RepID=A0A4C1WC84_EUMVA|nr:hypothetical protein EVAR_35628_1 [Eumeta japonica]